MVSFHPHTQVGPGLGGIFPPSGASLPLLKAGGEPVVGVGPPEPCCPAPCSVVSCAWGSMGPGQAALIISGPASLQVN